MNVRAVQKNVARMLSPLSGARKALSTFRNFSFLPNQHGKIAPGSENEKHEKDSAWHAGDRLVQTIRVNPDLWFLRHKTEIGRATAEAPNALTCIDERAAQGAMIVAKNGSVVADGSAGLGILLNGVKETLCGAPPSPEIIAFVNELKARNIRRLFPHAECGAAAAFAEKIGRIGEGDKFAKEWAEKLAELTGGVVEGYAPVYPEGFHDARAIYFDCTEDGRFVSEATSGVLPRGFHISRSCLGDDEAIFETGVAASIAFGAHGFGERFTDKNPLLVFVVSGSTSEAETYIKKLDGLSTTYGARISVHQLITN